MYGTISRPRPLDDLRSYADGLVDAAPALDPSTLRLLAGSPVPKRLHRFTVPAMAAIGVAVMLLVAEVGVTVAANSAVPGDGIYGIDLLVEDALVAIGIPIDRAAERIDEAEVLLDRSELSEAIRRREWPTRTWEMRSPPQPSLISLTRRSLSPRELTPPPRKAYEPLSAYSCRRQRTQDAIECRRGTSHQLTLQQKSPTLRDPTRIPES